MERIFPIKKNIKIYPERYDNFVFDKLNEMNNNIELQNDYKKWKSGINYNTNRKIKIDGKIHRELKQKFMIYHNGRGILFDILKNINIYEYLQETKKINNNIDVENVIIIDYNKSIDIIIEKIQNLENWNDFIEFEGKRYGIVNKVKNNIHIENNCFGNILLNKERSNVYCGSIRPYCNNFDIDGGTAYYREYKCDKCNWIYENVSYVND